MREREQIQTEEQYRGSNPFTSIILQSPLLGLMLTTRNSQ